MKILAEDISKHMVEIVTILRELSPNCIKTSIDLTDTIRQIRECQDAYHWIFLDEETDAEICAGLANIAFDTTGTKPVMRSLHTSNDATSGSQNDELGKWQHVLNFAARTPAVFHALRDAMSVSSTLIQYHALCLKSAWRSMTRKLKVWSLSAKNVKREHN